MRRLEPAGHVTRFATRTLCHVVIPSESGETRAALVRWSAGTLAVRTGLCETTACRLITQRLLVPVDASRDQHHKSPRTCRDVVSDTCPDWILACFACRFCSQTEWPTRKLGRLRSRASRSTTTPPNPHHGQRPDLGVGWVIRSTTPVSTNTAVQRQRHLHLPGRADPRTHAGRQRADTR